MASRLLAQLDAEIDAAKDPLERDRLRAERAGVLARHGNIGQARRIVNELRSRPHAAGDAELAAWLGLAEGMIDHFDSLSPRAKSRFLRAHALARAASLDALQALAAAWLAISEWNEMQVQAAVDHVAEALRLAPDDGHAARARACLVAADAWLFAGEADRAKPWFDRARAHAAGDGDMSMVSILLYNRAACVVSLAHLDDSFDRAGPEQTARALLEVESTGHFDAGVGTASLKALVPVVRAQALVALRRYPEALALYDAHLEAVLRQGLVASRPRFLADLATCRHHAGQTEAAHEAARQALDALDGAATQPDDRAATLARVATFYALTGEPARAEASRQLAQAALAEFRALQARMRDVLARTLAG